MQNRLLTAAIFSFFVSNAVGQLSARAVDTSRSIPAIEAYHQSFKDQILLYYGAEHIDYVKMDNSPYFSGNDWVSGSVRYNGLFYQNILMKYDQVRDKLVVQHLNKVFKVELLSQRVAFFTMDGHNFFWLEEQAGEHTTLPKGYYDLLVSGKISVLARRVKIVEDYIEGMEARKRILDKTTYYILKDGIYYPVKKERSFLALLDEKKREVQQNLRKSKLKFRRRPETVLITGAGYYNKTTN